MFFKKNLTSQKKFGLILWENVSPRTFQIIQSGHTGVSHDDDDDDDARQIFNLGDSFLIIKTICFS